MEIRQPRSMRGRTRDGAPPTTAAMTPEQRRLAIRRVVAFGAALLALHAAIVGLAVLVLR